jgi:hypothetical protein
MQRLLIFLALAFVYGTASGEDIVSLSTRPGITQSYLISAPASGKATAIAILFPGGAGKTDLDRESARTVLDRGNFLVRTRRLLAASGIAAVVMDAPSDQPSGMDDFFRLGPAHAEDIGKVVADLRKRFPGAPLFLVGTSRGTVSAAGAGRSLGKSVDGVVLTATLFNSSRTQPGLGGFDYASISAPLLFVHHVSDGCTYTPYSGAKRLAERYPLISVSGGPPPQSKPCDAMSQHGFLGKEAETIDAMVKWMLKQPYGKEIN